MTYITGDIHGVPWRIYKFAKKFKLTTDDTIVILGDVGANYFGNERDTQMKNALSKHPVTILCIHGNHEMRPWEAGGYHLKEWKGGMVYVEDKHPNLLFAKDGEIYNIDGYRCMPIGGAYSVDVYYRLRMGSGWWASEQPTQAIKDFVEKQLAENEIDIIFSHTCPAKYEPIETYLPYVNQKDVDKSTEQWLDIIEDRYTYTAWFCGHWHIDKRIDKIHFLFNSWEMLEPKESRYE